MRLIGLAVILTVSLLILEPLAVEAQQAGKAWRIGLLSSASSSAGADRLLALKQGLHALGYVQGQNLTIEYRWAEGRDDRLPALAADLVRLKVDMIVTQGVPLPVSWTREGDITIALPALDRRS